MKVCFTCALYQSRSLHGLHCSQILSFCVHIFLLCLTHSTSLPLDQHILLHYTLGRASSIGGLHTSPFLPTASDFHQLGIFCLLCLFDTPLWCALSGQIQEYMSSPRVVFQKIFSFWIQFHWSAYLFFLSGRILPRATSSPSQITGTSPVVVNPNYSG